MKEIIKKNKIIKSSIIACFIVFALLFPVSISISPNAESTSFISSVQLQVEANISYAVIGKILEASVGSIIDFIGYSMMTLASLATQMCGMLLDLTLKFTVFEMGKLINSQKLGGTIDNLWSVIRDICNLAFIFGFIYVGIRTIIDPDSADTKRFLSRIIIGALLINFSLFFVKIIVDFSNFTALQIYSAMLAGSTTSISAVVANLLGIATLYQVTDPAALASISGGDGRSISFYLFGSLFLLTTAFVFLAGAILLIIRFVSLILIMIGSPILFAGSIFPQTEDYAKDLWKKLISNAIFAPVYLLLILISITILQSLELSTLNSSFATGLGLGDTLLKLTETNLVTILNFVIITGFMIGSITIANKMGIQGSEMAVKVAGAASYGLAAKASRATIGRYAHNISERDDLKDAASQKGARGVIARGLLQSSRKVGDSSFDVRNTGEMSKKLGIGQGSKGGYKTVLGEIEDKEMKFAKSLGEVDDDDARVAKFKKDATEAEEEIKKLKEKRTTLGNSEDDLNEKRTIVTKIQNLEVEQKKKNEMYNQEKQRRVLGSKYTATAKTETITKAESLVKNAENDLAVSWKEYNEEKDADAREIILGALNELQSKVTDAKKALKYEKSRGTDKDGYANVLKGSTLFTSWPFGRLATQEIEVGQEIEKAFTKKIKKSKEDARADTLVDAVKSSKS